MAAEVTYLGIELVDTTHGLFDPTFLDGLANLHPLLDHRLVDICRLTRLARKRDGRIGEAFDEEVV